MKATALPAAHKDSALWVGESTAHDGFQLNLAILSLVKQQYLPSHAGHVICLLLLMPVRTEELRHSESICGLEDLGVMWRFGFWVVKEPSAVTPGKKGGNQH